MGQKPSSNSKKAAECPIPAYCLRTLGCRHILVGGGGGSAKTGVKNQLLLYLLGYDTRFDLATKMGGEPGSAAVVAQPNGELNTGEFANMNMDCLALCNEPGRGQHMVAVGQNQFCALFETTGFCVAESNGAVNTAHRLESPPSLSFRFNCLARIQTDRYPGKESYQNCVRLFRLANSEALKMATGGTDGYVRVWSIPSLLKSIRRRRQSSVKSVDFELLNHAESEQDDEDEMSDSHIPTMRDAVPELEICTGSAAIDELDISACGTLLATVLPGQTVLWDLSGHGKQLAELPTSDEADGVLSKKFKVRSLRFTRLDKTGKKAIFVTAHNQRVRSSKEVSFLGLWMYAKESANKGCELIRSTTACNESLSCLELSECGQFSAFGTMGGSVGIFDTQSLCALLLLRNAHSSFVTALTFLPKRAYDIKDLGRIGDDAASSASSTLPHGRCFLPGVVATARCAIATISVDQTIKVHQLPYPSSDNPMMAFLLFRLPLLAVILYIILWALFVRG